MRVFPLAADSLGVRSMATYVECGAQRVLIDPGATLGASRFSLPPSQAEWQTLRRANDRISAYAGRASLVFVSHYHEDHFRWDPGCYAGRLVWAKDPQRMIPAAQQLRGRDFWKAVRAACRLEPAEGQRYQTADCILSASPPLSHGVDGSEQGYVVALTLTDPREGERFVFAGDVQGPLSAVVTAYLVRERPTLLYLSGPPAYLEHRLGAPLIERGVENLLRIIDATGCRVIMDHHAVRDRDWEQRFRRLWETGRVVTAAGFLGTSDSPLEAWRARLWAQERKPATRMDPGLKGREGPGKMSRRAGSAPDDAWTTRRKGGKAR